MKRFLTAVALAFAMTLLAGQAQADKKSPKKADVVLKVDDRAGKAKVGQTIELQLPNTPPPEADDITVKVEGDAIDPVTERRAAVVKQDGKPVSGKGSASVILKAKAPGKAKVKVDYKAGGKRESREYEIEVTP
ncbi:MAG: hypothetical protein JWO38_3481 [Gemmataceae bacterium]|nr:hypothetical protein [Gemmataceae bacterium]